MATARPTDWIEFVNEPERESELEDLRSSAQRGRPYGSEDWMIRIAKQFGLERSVFARSAETFMKRLPTLYIAPAHCLRISVILFHAIRRRYKSALRLKTEGRFIKESTIE
jgi:hypothetical protein